MDLVSFAYKKIGRQLRKDFTSRNIFFSSSLIKLN